MFYIKVNGTLITTAGTVATPEMLKDGYFEYHGDVPVLNADEVIGWDEVTGSLIVVSSLTEDIVRERRNNLLISKCDSITPLKWNAMSLSQQQAWTKYRQDLLDIPLQSGFPTSIIWPTEPV